MKQCKTCGGAKNLKYPNVWCYALYATDWNTLTNTMNIDHTDSIKHILNAIDKILLALTNMEERLQALENPNLDYE